MVAHVHKFRRAYTPKMPADVSPDLVKELLGDCLAAFEKNLENVLEHIVLTQGKKVYKDMQAAQTKVDQEAMTEEQKKKLGSFGSKVSGAFGALKELLSDKIIPYKQGQNILSLIQVGISEKFANLIFVTKN